MKTIKRKYLQPDELLKFTEGKTKRKERYFDEAWTKQNGNDFYLTYEVNLGPRPTKLNLSFVYTDLRTGKSNSIVEKIDTIELTLPKQIHFGREGNIFKVPFQFRTAYGQLQKIAFDLVEGPADSRVYVCVSNSHLLEQIPHYSNM